MPKRTKREFLNLPGFAIDDEGDYVPGSYRQRKVPWYRKRGIGRSRVAVRLTGRPPRVNIRELTLSETSAAGDLPVVDDCGQDEAAAISPGSPLGVSGTDSVPGDPVTGSVYSELAASSSSCGWYSDPVDFQHELSNEESLSGSVTTIDSELAATSSSGGWNSDQGDLISDSNDDAAQLSNEESETMIDSELAKRSSFNCLDSDSEADAADVDNHSSSQPANQPT